MTPSFNLIDQPWIPCLAPDGNRLCLGIRETLVTAHRVREIASSSPIVTAAIHRLLLAILHRNFGPKTVEDWETLWSARRFDPRTLDDYFKRWRHRFDLFDSTRPFYQCASLSSEEAKPAAILAPELASGNNATLFDHTTRDNSPLLSAPRAAGLLLALQSFAVGGLVSLQRGQDPKKYKSARGAPLVKAAVALVRGNSLFEDLILNLHRYDPANEEPFSANPDDVPAWERDSEPQPKDRYPDGYLDYLTWQNRRLLLIPESSVNGQPSVRSAIRMKGEQIPEDWSLHDRETMVTFLKSDAPSKPGSDPWTPVTFRVDRSVWRDSLALFESAASRQARPKTLDWLHSLIRSGILPRSAAYNLHLLGLSTDQAKVLLWRHDRMPLPLIYLESRALVSALRQVLALAEKVGDCLRDATRQLAERLLAPQPAGSTLPRRPDKSRLQQLLESLSPQRPFWAALDTEFNRFLVDLANDAGADEDGQELYGLNVMPRWCLTVHQAAVRSFAGALNSLGTSPRVLKAVSPVESWLRRRLRNLVQQYVPLPEVTNAPARNP